MRDLRPGPTTKVLDVGVSNYRGRATNFFEDLYPWRANITAVAHGEKNEFAEFCVAYPEIRLVLADGRDMPFADDEFDIVFSNAVIEHVGPRTQQARFLSECLRVGRALFLSTPNAGFPVDAHTLLPFVHWLPVRLRYYVYRHLGRSYWADVDHLNLLRKKDFLGLIPAGVRWQLREDRLGLVTNFVLVAWKHETPQDR